MILQTEIGADSPITEKSSWKRGLNRSTYAVSDIQDYRLTGYVYDYTIRNGDFLTNNSRKSLFIMAGGYQT